MKKRTIVFLTLIVSTIGAVAAERRIAFERKDAIYVVNLDGSGEKKVAAGLFPAISPDATRVAFTTVEKTGETYIRHIAVADIASGNVTMFKDVPSTNVYYSTWSPDGKRILFTLRRNELWEIVSTAADGSDFKVIKKGEPSAVTLYSPCWARDGESIFCQNMTNIYQIALDGHELAHWEIKKIVRNGDMSGDGRIDVSPDGKRLLLSVDMGEEANRKTGMDRCRHCGCSTSLRKKPRASRPSRFSVGTAAGWTTTMFCSAARRRAKRSRRFTASRPRARTRNG